MCVHSGVARDTSNMLHGLVRDGAVCIAFRIWRQEAQKLHDEIKVLTANGSNEDLHSTM